MATFRSSGLVVALLCLACAPRESSDPPRPEVAAITRQQIDHVTPRRDFVGPAPARLEWSAVEGVETYTITVVTEIDSVVLQLTGSRGPAIEWPKEIALEPCEREHGDHGGGEGGGEDRPAEVEAEADDCACEPF